MLLLRSPHGSSFLARNTVRNRVRTVVLFKDPKKESAAAFDLIPSEPNLEPIVQHPLLDRTEHDLEKFCGGLDDEDEKQQCLRVHKYLHDQHEQFSQGCKRELDEEGQPGKSCQGLEKLEDMVRQVEGTKTDLIKAMSVMEKIKKREETGEKPSAELSPNALATLEMANACEDLKQKALHLFHQVDRNGDGRLDVDEFRDCMKLFSHELSGDEVMQIFSCLDGHGFITEEQFVDVIIADKERLEHPHCDAELLRHLHLHPAWWSERPASVDSL